VIQDAIGIDGHHAIGQLADVPNVLVSHVIRGFPLFSVARLVNTQHE
jgi:hypothetical protein